MKKLSISVIVPVYNHWELIPKLLDGLQSQDISGDDFEVIIVDNGSTYIPSNLKLPKWCKLLSCSTPGSYAARNVGVEAARGHLLAFTDADCVATPTWLSSGWRRFLAEPVKTLIAGGVCVEPLDWCDMTSCEMYDVALGLPQQRYVRNGYAVTANLFIPKKAFEEIGIFDDKRFSGGDADFCRRATAQGWSLNYCDEACVLHPARRNLNELKTKQRRVVGGQLRSGPLRRRIKYGIALLLPPIRAWKMAIFSKRLSLKQRVQVCFIVAFLKLIGLLEMIRLIFGGNPERR